MTYGHAAERRRNFLGFAVGAARIALVIVGVSAPGKLAAMLAPEYARSRNALSAVFRGLR